MNLSAGLLATYMHQMSPFFLEFWPGVGIRWYGLSYLTGAVVGAGIIWWMARRGRARIAPSLVSEFAINLLIGAFIGGRLGFCLLYEPKLLGLVNDFPFWGVLAIQHGGMASHGGMIGMLTAAWWFARKNGLPLLHLLDLACLVGPLGVMLGRFANFINGELYGRECSPALGWGVTFPKEIYSWSAEQLRLLTGVAEKVGIKPETWILWTRDPESHESSISTGLIRMVEAIEHGDVTIAGMLSPLLTPRYPSQLIQAGLEGFLVFVILAFIWCWPRKPGVVSAWFVILYAIARIVGEQFRMPDQELGFELFGMTRGQELSAVMLLAGIAMLVWVIVRRAAKEPAWIGPKMDANRF